MMPLNVPPKHSLNGDDSQPKRQKVAEDGAAPSTTGVLGSSAEKNTPGPAELPAANHQTTTGQAPCEKCFRITCPQLVCPYPGLEGYVLTVCYSNVKLCRTTSAAKVSREHVGAVANAGHRKRCRLCWSRDCPQPNHWDGLNHCWLSSTDEAARWWRAKFFGQFWPQNLAGRSWHQVPAAEKDSLLSRLWGELVPQWNEDCWDKFGVAIDWRPRVITYQKKK